MRFTRPTFTALLLGTVLGAALATSAGVLAARRADNAAPATQDSRLLAEVMANVREQYVDAVDEHTLMQHAIRGMVAGLDAHSTFLDEQELAELRIGSEGRYAGIGIEVSLENGSIVVIAALDGSPAAAAGLQTGDVIVAVDGRQVIPAALAEAVARVRGEPGTVVRLTIERPGVEEPLRLSVERASIAVQSVRLAQLEPGYGYLRISHFTDATPQELEQSVATLRRQAGDALRGLVLDLRDNPGGVLESGVAVADDFLESGVIVRARGQGPEASFVMSAEAGEVAAGVPLVVLVNAGSASAAEIVAAALRDNGRATLIGRRSFGKGSVQTVLPLSEGRAIKLTTSRFYAPSGEVIDERGIDPDVELPRPDATRALPPAEDVEIVAALNWLKSARGQRLAVAGAAGR